LLGVGFGELAGSARALDRRTSGLRELVGADGQCDRELATTKDLHRHVALLRQAGVAQLLEPDGRAVAEARGEIVEVDVLGVRAERRDRHRHLLVRAAQLAQPHVDRVLAALEARTVLGARTRAVALVAAARGLAMARAMAAPHALAVAPRAGGGLQRVK